MVSRMNVCVATCLREYLGLFSLSFSFSFEERRKWKSKLGIRRIDLNLLTDGTGLWRANVKWVGRHSLSRRGNIYDD